MLIWAEYGIIVSDWLVVSPRQKTGLPHLFVLAILDSFQPLFVLHTHIYHNHTVNVAISLYITIIPVSLKMHWIWLRTLEVSW